MPPFLLCFPPFLLPRFLASLIRHFPDGQLPLRPPSSCLPRLRRRKYSLHLPISGQSHQPISNPTPATHMASISNDPINALPTDFYTSAFKNQRPRHAYSLLIGRLKDAKATNDHLADYFRDRLVIEDQYLKALLKLSKRPSSAPLQQRPHEPNSPPLLGSFSQLLHQELLAIIDRHEAYQLKLHADVEQSIRNCSVLGPPNWPSIKALDDQLNGLVKTYEDCDQRAQKSRSKLAAATNPKKLAPLHARLAEDEQMLEQATQSWLQHATEAFKSLQRYDHQRLLNLVESLAKFETIQADHAREQMDIAERSLAALLTFDAQEDLQRFAIANGQLPEPPSSTRSRAPDVDRPTPAPGDRAQHGLDIARPPVLSDSPPQLPDDPPAQPPSNLPRSPPPGSLATYDPNHADIPRLNTPNVSVPLRPSPAEQPVDPSLPSRALYVQRQSSLRSVKNLYRTGSSQDLNRSQPHPSPLHKSSTSGSSITEKLFSKARLTNMLARTGPGGGPGARRRGSQTSERPSSDASRPARSASLLGAARAPISDLYALDAPATRPASRISQLLPSAIHPGSRRKNSDSIGSAAAPTRLDAEGYSIPPEDRGRTPWEMDTEGGDRTEVLSGSDDDGKGQMSHRPGPSHDDAPPSAARSAFAIAPPTRQPTDSDAEREAAIARVQHTLSDGLALGGPRRSNTALRGRRADGRGATVYEPTGGGERRTGAGAVSEDGHGWSGRALVSQDRGGGAGGVEAGGQMVSRRNSLRSGVGSPIERMAVGGEEAGAMMEVRVRERLDVLMDGGAVVKVMVLGEIDVCRRGKATEGLAIRLKGFEGLDKVVPAPALAEAQGGGVYRLLEGAGRGTGVCVVKYRQLVDGRTGGGASRLVPLTVRPMWRTSAGRTEVAVGWERNGAWEEEGSLSEVSFGTVVYKPEAGMVPRHQVAIEVEGQQSVPAGKWDGSANRLEWTVGQIKFDKLDTQAEAEAEASEDSSKAPKANAEAKGRLLGRFIHSGKEGDLESCGPVLVKFKVHGRTVSGVEVEVVEVGSCFDEEHGSGDAQVLRSLSESHHQQQQQQQRQQEDDDDESVCEDGASGTHEIKDGKGKGKESEKVGGLGLGLGLGDVEKENDKGKGKVKEVKVFVKKEVETGMFWAR